MLIDWIITNALTIFWYIISIYILVKVIVILAMMGLHNFFWIFIGSVGIESEHDIKNTFDEGLKKYLITSNRINKIFYWIAGATLFIYFFTQLLIL